jgi:hypothetical protein
MLMRIIKIVALIGGTGLILLFAPYIIQSASSSDEQILQKANNRQEVSAFQERFGPIAPVIERHGSAIYVYYAANRTYYYDFPYDESDEPVQASRILQLTVLFDGWVTKVSMMCGGDMEPTTLEADTLTIKNNTCLYKDARITESIR